MSEETFAEFPKAVQDRIAVAQAPVPGIKRKVTTPLTSGFTASPALAPVHASVPVQAPGFTNPSADPEGISVALPSEFAFYGFKDLYVKPFRAFHLAKLSKAHEDRSMLPMVEAVSSVLSTTTQGLGPLAFHLNVADFYFVLYWLKLHSFSKATLINTSMCLNEAHIKRVQDGELPEESLKITTIITNAQLEIKHLTELPDPAIYKLPDPYICRPATMRDTVEFLENPNWLDSEYQYLGRIASNFTSKDNPQLSLAEKIEIVSNFDGDTCFMLQKYEEVVDCFGVEEKIKLKCNGCGASRDSKLVLDAHSFLSA